jgi:hypothetical protein
LFHHGTECDVLGYYDELGTMTSIPVMTVDTAVDDVKSHMTHILIFTFDLYFVPKIKQYLICLNQCREGGTIINECPHQFIPASKHGLTSPDETLFVPFKMHGQTSCLLSRQPSEKGLDECQRHYLTSEKEWDPISDQFAEAEMNVLLVLRVLMITIPSFSQKKWQNDGELLLKLYVLPWKRQLPSVQCIMSGGTLGEGLRLPSSN